MTWLGLTVPDTGYTALCPRCAVPHRFDKAVVGRERWLASELCAPCIKRKVGENEVKRAAGLRLWRTNPYRRVVE